jgi:hypothetical protein
MIGVLLAAILAAMGRVWWCQAGDVWPWSWDIWSRHNSQHLVDPYTLSHLEHGIGLYVLLFVLTRRFWTTFACSLVVSGVESAWEIVENTNWMIERYREVTISLDYYGDSILNSVSDYGSCIVGTLIASRMPLWAACVLFVCLELISVVWIRDSLLLNVLMLISPIDAIRQWQMSGAPG